MPKIEVNEKLFFSLLGEQCDYEKLENRLESAKAELDEKADSALSENERTIKIELNDTNRPDLWSTAGIARCLRVHREGNPIDYASFLSTKAKTQDFANRVVHVDAKLKDIRPFMTAFVISGKPIDQPMLLDIIQTQEKLCWNYGRKRRSISMGVYRSANISWPVQYTAVNPDETSFIPLAHDEKMTCRQIITDHPKGKEYGSIIKDFDLFPLLIDTKKEILSLPPIINSATLGAVQVGDSDLLVEMTGTDMPSLLLATSIVACDFFDAGYKILPVQVNHPYETGFGKSIVTPFYFQEQAKTSVSAVNKMLGSSFGAGEIVQSLSKMDIKATNDGEEITICVPAYRNDFLHEVDIIEDVMIGNELSSFTPEKPRDFTIGRLTPITLFSRRAKSVMVGFGYQEMIFNYLGSKSDFITKMNIDEKNVIEIANPMTENYQYVRPSIIPSLLSAESISGNAVYPHKIFEIGKIAYLCKTENTGTQTRQSIGFLTAASDANYNTVASEVASFLYFLGFEYKVKESEDPRFILGRQASILLEKASGASKVIGIFGELNPVVLENWAITVPCIACEIDLNQMI
ncbi:MAG: phenylalanine--tRNA ligase subunit beta [Treponemataceae bacterium]